MMDKRKVIAAYQRGIITIQECGQILGMEDSQLNVLLDHSVQKQAGTDFSSEPVKGSLYKSL